MKKYSRTIIFGILTLLTVSIVYLFDSVGDSEKDQKTLLVYDRDQINYIQVIKDDQKIGLQKSEEGWSLKEPIQDQGDNDNIEAFLTEAATEKQISVVKNSETELSEIELSEFGLDKPAIVFNFKSNLGQTRKISVGSIKSYEGNTYLRVDSDNKVIMASAFWSTQAQNEMIYYRYKKLYRGNLAGVNKIKVKSLRDTFELVKINNTWESSEDKHPLDQNRIRELLRKIAETKIENYIFEGEPSLKILNDKGLNEDMALNLEMFSEESSWSAKINLNTNDKAVYAFTERPTFLVQLELDSWEAFGNLKLDELRDRNSALTFNEKEVAKIYFKYAGQEGDIFQADGKWKIRNGTETLDVDGAHVAEIIAKIKSLKVSEFLDSSDGYSKFVGDNMVILRSSADKLLLQMNWGPQFSMKKSGQEKEYFYTRTHHRDQTFALEKSAVDNLELERLKALQKPTDSGNVSEKN